MKYQFRAAASFRRALAKLSPVPLGESFTTITIIKGAATMSIAPGKESGAGSGWRICAREPRLEEPSIGINTKSYWTGPASNLNQ